MRKFLLVTAILFTLTGCAYMAEHHANAKACLADAACAKEVQDEVSVWKTVASASGFPAAGVAVGVVGTYLFAFFKKRKTK